MDRLFDSLKGFFQKPPINIDNLAYRIHYRATFVVLVAFSLMVTSELNVCFQNDSLEG